MASTVNITVEDTSPLISYEPALAWTDSPQDDPLVPQSSASSLRTTSQPGATASLSFIGSGIWLFGSNGPQHGQYAVSIDDGPQLVFNGFAPTTTAQVPLLRAAGLAPGPHTVVITNLASVTQPSTLDIDFAVFEAQLSEPELVDDAQVGAAFQFIPEDGSWINNPQPIFMGSTSKFTQTPNARMVFDFEGSGIALYGSVSQPHAPYSVSIDGTTRTFTPSASRVHARTLLFFDGSLAPGSHQIAMSNDGLDGSQYIDFDYAEIFQATQSGSGDPAPAVVTSSPSVSDEAQSPTQGLPNSGKRFSPAVIAGISFGALFGLCIVLAILILLRKCRNRTRSSLDYPFKGISGFADRFKKASLVERGESQSKWQPPLSDKVMENTVSSRPAVPTIITNFSAPTATPTFAASSGSNPVAARAAPVITSLAPAARNPAFISGAVITQQKVARKAVPTVAAPFIQQPQRPPIRPPPIEYEPDVRGPDRPSRPQTQLMLSPAVPVATRTFGEGRNDGAGRI
jgi:hypothetical protein